MGNKVSAVSGVKSPNFYEPGNAVNEIWIGELEIISRLPFGDSDMAQAGWPKNDYPKFPWRPFVIPLFAMFANGAAAESTTPSNLSRRSAPEDTDSKIIEICFLIVMIICTATIAFCACSSHIFYRIHNKERPTVKEMLKRSTTCLHSVAIQSALSKSSISAYLLRLEALSTEETQSPKQLYPSTCTVSYLLVIQYIGTVYTAALYYRDFYQSRCERTEKLMNWDEEDQELEKAKIDGKKKPRPKKLGFVFYAATVYLVYDTIMTGAMLVMLNQSR